MPRQSSRPERSPAPVKSAGKGGRSGRTGKKPAPAAAAAAQAASTHRGRARGRPGTASPELRPLLLEAALACYAARGIAATPLRDIAARAGVTPALLHYYFGDKNQLLQAVIDECVVPAVIGLRDAVERAGDSAAELVAAFVDGVAAAVARHPWLPALWVREVVSEGGVLRARLADRVTPALGTILAGRLGRAQARGGLNPDLDPRLLVASLIGLTMYPLAGAPVWRQVFGDAGLGAEDLRRHTLALLDRGLEPRDA